MRISAASQESGDIKTFVVAAGAVQAVCMHETPKHCDTELHYFLVNVCINLI